MTNGVDPGVRRVGWRIQLRSGAFMSVAWLGGVGLGLGWGVVLARQSAPPSRAPSPSRAPQAAVRVGTPVLLASAPAPRRPLPRGLVCYPSQGPRFDLPAHLRPRAPGPEPTPPRAVVTRSEVGHASPPAEPSEASAAEPQPAPEPVQEEVAEAAPLDPAELARAEAELARVRAYHAQSARIQALAKQAREAEEWVLRAIMAQELARLKDPRVVAALGGLLADERDEVVYFTLLGLAEYSGHDLRHGGGRDLALALVAAAGRGQRDLRDEAYRLLQRLSGEELPSRPRPWKRWIEAHESEFAGGLEAPAFDEGAYAPAVVARVRTGGGTRVRDDPSATPGDPVFSELEELQRRGLDLVVCLDQTSSMEGVIQAAKGNLGTFGAVLGALVKKHRIGLVTYKDGVTGRLSLGRGADRFRAALEGVWANGGGDVEEGVDKAVASALQRDMGWRKEASKVVVIVGDAPPHAPDVASLLFLAKTLHERQGVVFHAVDCGGLGGDVAQLARDSEGSVVRLTASDTLIYQILGLVFGKELRPAVERFLDTYLAWARRS
ncbi:MAG: VWA domain-containing protein [Planctomycetes bacterium]|nr:VWA domain-containing protein [Planctomycetota bacterium]